MTLDLRVVDLSYTLGEEIILKNKLKKKKVRVFAVVLEDSENGNGEAS